MMSEEEIKAIKSIGLELEMTGDMPRIILYRKDIKKVLKLIEKQQGVINSLNFRIVRQEECIKELKKKNETQPDRAEPVEKTDEQEVTKKVAKKVVKKITYKGEEFGHGATQEVVDDIDDYCTAINGLIDGLAIKINEIIDYLTGEEEANPEKPKTKRKEKK